MIAKDLLSLLVCPLSKAHLRYDKENHELLCEHSGLAYPIRQNIPIMLIEEARVFDEEKYERALLSGNIKDPYPSCDDTSS